MDDLIKAANELSANVKAATDKLNIKALDDKLKLLKMDSQKADFWADSEKAQTLMKEMANLENRVKPWNEVSGKISELRDMLKLNDESLVDELSSQVEELEKQFDSLKDELKFNGQFDDHGAIVSIYAGAGGTDAQDWTQMLLRMYSRWFEKNNWSISVIDESAGDEAGLKSVTIEVRGAFAYGKLKGEHGVHRLVRLSPFNSDNLRQTSFAKVDVLPMLN
jgi:peptide chain release factor 2